MRKFRQQPGLSLVHLRLAQLPSGSARHENRNAKEWTFGAALAFWKRKQLQGVLFLHRTAKEGDFSETELNALRDLQPHLETALCRVIAVRRIGAQKQLLAGVFKPLPLPLVLCDWRLKVICESAAGLEARAGWERELLEPLAARRALPSDLAGFCRERIKTWEKASPADREILENRKYELAHPHAIGRRVEVSMLRQKNFPLIEPFFLLRFLGQPTTRESGVPSPRGAGSFASLARLSVCEREIALLVYEGHSNARISHDLGKSIHTVKAQLHSIFRKLQVSSRSKMSALMARGLAPSLLLFAHDIGAIID